MKKHRWLLALPLLAFAACDPSEPPAEIDGGTTTTLDAHTAEVDASTPAEDASTPEQTTCCLALEGTEQSFCDSLPQTEGRCNAANGGASCAWSESDTCNPPEPEPCCIALAGTEQSYCDGLPQTEGRCNGADGGASCAWSESEACNPAP